eukprot:273683_1
MNIIYVLVIIIALISAQWIESESPLLRGDSSFAIGAYNDTIFTIGGLVYDTQVSAWSIYNQQWTDLGEYELPDHVRGSGQFWTQQLELLYVMEHDSKTTTTFGVFNMKTKEYTTNALNLAWHPVLKIYLSLVEHMVILLRKCKP